MRELTYEEEQWLRLFAKENEFFNSLLNFYERKGFLSYKQRFWLRKEINKADDEGDTVLPKDELLFLKEYANKDSDLEEMLEAYENYGYFDDYEYREFIKLKLKHLGKEEKESSDVKEIKAQKMNIDNLIKKVPCPHCNFLCLTQAKSCLKCGEPLKTIFFIGNHKKYKPKIELKDFDKLKKTKYIPKSNDTLYERFKESQKKGLSLKQKYLSELGKKRGKIEKDSNSLEKGKKKEKYLFLNEEKIQDPKEIDQLIPLDKPLQTKKKKVLLTESTQTIKEKVLSNTIDKPAQIIDEKKLVKNYDKPFQTISEKKLDFLTKKEPSKGISHKKISQPKAKLKTEKKPKEFSLFAIDVNNLIESFKRLYPNNYINIKPPLEILKEKYLQKASYKAHLFASKHLESQKRFIPESEDNHWHIESYRKRKYPGQYVDVDVTLAVQTAILIEKYKSRISHFYLGSGDKDFHSIIKIARRYNIPVSLIVCSRNNVSIDLLQLVNFDVDVLYEI